jgi:hypothetical protein
MQIRTVIYVKKLIIMLIQLKFGYFLAKIEQFWPFEEISIFSNGGHLGYRTVLTDTILKGSFQQSLGLCKLEKSDEEIKKIFCSEITEPISTKLC